ncbi:MAG: multiprotein-bridging factor 1 family protein [Xanthobacteraceae bacterium]|jgi:transcriptional regulator with XRE-family HTH domain|uniref:helix-turn-helix domain-containing protein n=1 Tax=Pseudolabrys sp. TaxID=1960880 RepID=UPI003D0BC94A
MSLYETVRNVAVSPSLIADRQDPAAFATCVRMARAALNWSQHDLARQLGMTQRSVHRIEQGHCEPRRVTVLAIENLLRSAGVSFEHDATGGVTMSVVAVAVTTHAEAAGAAERSGEH